MCARWLSPGSCFQKDILNLVYLCESFGLPEVAAYWNQVIVMNDYQKKRFALKMIEKMFNTIAGKKIAILGFAFKKDTGDTRETAAIYVSQHLLNERAVLAIYDPQVEEEQIRADFDEYKVLDSGMKFDEYVTVQKDIYSAVQGAHSIAIMTEWDEFKSIDYERCYKSMSKPACIFDGRNILDHAKLKQIGFDVYAIGPHSTTHSCTHTHTHTHRSAVQAEVSQADTHLVRCARFSLQASPSTRSSTWTAERGLPTHAQTGRAE